MTLKVFFDLMSQPSRAVILFLKVNSIPYQSCPVALRKGEHLTEEYSKNINPFQRVPAINDNGFKLTESVAILRYLCREHNVPDHWYPRDSRLQARVDEYLEWQHLDTRFGCSMYFQSKFLQPVLTNVPPEAKRVDRFKRSMEKSLDMMENVWLKDSPYLAGQKISIADILGICELEQPKMAGYDVKDGRPRIAAWMDRVQADLKPHYDEVTKYVNIVASKYGGDHTKAKL